MRIEDIVNAYSIMQTSAKFALETKGRKNCYPDLFLAEMIARKYYEHLGQLPSTAKASKNSYGKDSSTPYDRVCNVIEKTLKVKMGPKSRMQACKVLKR